MLLLANALRKNGQREPCGGRAMDLRTTYLGLDLKNPVVASASPLSTERLPMTTRYGRPNKDDDSTMGRLLKATRKASDGMHGKDSS